MKKILAAIFSTFLFVSFAHAAGGLNAEQNATLDGTWGSSNGDC